MTLEIQCAYSVPETGPIPCFVVLHETHIGITVRANVPHHFSRPNKADFWAIEGGKSCVQELLIPDGSIVDHDSNPSFHYVDSVTSLLALVGMIDTCVLDFCDHFRTECFDRVLNVGHDILLGVRAVGRKDQAGRLVSENLFGHLSKHWVVCGADCGYNHGAI